MKRIFVATDGSDGGTRAIVFAAHLAATSHVPLSIVAVSNPVPSTEMRAFGRMEHMTTGDLIDMEAQNLLRDARDRAALLGATVEKWHALIGDPAEQILEVIGEYKPDLLVVGRRGRGRLAGLLLGSVSQKLVCLSTVPVTVVP